MLVQRRMYKGRADKWKAQHWNITAPTITKF
jgi:hypothetical protein